MATLLSFFVIGCINAEAEKVAKEEETVEQEVMVLDYATAGIKNVNEGIKAATEEADALLNDL